MKQLGKLFATKTGNQKLILDGIRLVKPDYAITAEDEAQRSERRQISKTARDNMFRFAHQTIDLKFDRNQPEGENYDPDKPVSIPAASIFCTITIWKMAQRHTTSGFRASLRWMNVINSATMTSIPAPR